MRAILKTFTWMLLLTGFFIAIFPGLSQAFSAIKYEEAKAAISKGAILVDVRSEEEYNRGHLPGALNVPFWELMDNTRHLLPPEDLAAILSDYGVGKQADTIVYGKRGSVFATYMGWILYYLGADNTLVFTGGVEDWADHGDGMSSEKATPQPAEFEPDIREDSRVDAEFITKHLNTGDITILDARSAGEYFGQDIRSLRGGHIPGAINIDYAFCLNPVSMDLAATKRLKSTFAMIPKDKPVIVYCQIGARASLSLLALKEAGFKDVRLFPESWKDWGSNLALPVKDETFFNFHNVNAELSDLRSKNSRLDSELQRVSALSASNIVLFVIACFIAYGAMIFFLLSMKGKTMTVGSWVMVIIVTGFIGFLVGYSISSYTGVEGGNYISETGGYK